MAATSAMKHHPISGCSHKKSVTILRNCFSLSKICNTQLDGYHGNYRHHPKIKYEYFLPQPSISGYKSTGSYIYVNNSAGRNSCERLKPIESPFLHCKTPIVRIWNGWDFLNYTQDRNSHVQLQSIKSIDCLETRLQSSALLNYMNDPRLLNNNERHTISLMINKGMSPLGCHSNDKPTSAQLSFVLLKLRDEVSTLFCCLSNCMLYFCFSYLSFSTETIHFIYMNRTYYFRTIYYQFHGQQGIEFY